MINFSIFFGNFLMVFANIYAPTSYKLLFLNINEIFLFYYFILFLTLINKLR